MLLAGIDNIDSWHDAIGFLKQETTCFFDKTGASEIPRIIVSAAQVFHIVGLKAHETTQHVVPLAGSGCWA